MYIPMSKKEMAKLGWEQLDIIFITGDAYIDSPQIGVALLGKYLIEKGYKVGLIAQPDLTRKKDITALGEPTLFWGVSGGSVDSMVANYTASKKFRKQDDYTPGGSNNKRPDRAVIRYVNLIRQYFKKTQPIVLGGIEASLRRITHYDYWSNKIRKPILFNAKADYLLYGMAEKSTLNLADALRKNKSPENIRGLCYIAKKQKKNYIELPGFDIVKQDKNEFVELFHQFYQNTDPVNSKGLCQKIDNRYLIQNPPEEYMTEAELSSLYKLNFHRNAHPKYNQKIRALDTIRFSVPTHRGCYGECNFCAIAVHEGTRVRWRNANSITREIKEFTKHKKWNGNVSDLSGPTANMYGYECNHKISHGKCQNRRCMYPKLCSNIQPDHSKQLALLKKIEKIEGVKKIFISSGIRPELIKADSVNGEHYLRKIVKDHVSGQLKIAPESTSDTVLNYMGKPGFEHTKWFKRKFDKYSKIFHKRQFLTYYFIAAHPGCDEKEMKKIRHQIFKTLKIRPEQVQIFTPTPSTYSSVMYYTEKDPFSGKKIFVEKSRNGKVRQKNYLVKRKRKQ